MYLTIQIAKIPAIIANTAATPLFDTKEIAPDEGVELSAAAELDPDDAEELVGTELVAEAIDLVIPVPVLVPVVVPVVVLVAVPLVGVALPLLEVKVIVTLLIVVGTGPVGVIVVRELVHSVACRAKAAVIWSGQFA